MTRGIAAAAAVLAGATTAAGQGLTPTTRTVSLPGGGPFGVPGTPVGSSVGPVGQKIAPAAPGAGTPIGFSGPGGMPVTTQRPAGQVVDLSNLAAPLTAPLAPGLVPSQDKSLLQKAYERWAAAIGISKPEKDDLKTNWTPGLGRRNRERARLPWLRD